MEVYQWILKILKILQNDPALIPTNVYFNGAY